MGKQFRDEGIHLHYHNHDFEFLKVDGNKTGMDILMEGLDFRVVDLCVDVAWVMRGGDDPNGRPGDKKAREEAWKRLLETLKKL